MRAEIRERLADKIPLAPAKPKPDVNDLLDQIDSPKQTLADMPAFTRQLVDSLPEIEPRIPADTRCWLTVRTPTGEQTIQIPENVACNYRARYGKAPGFEKYFLDRIRDLLNVS